MKNRSFAVNALVLAATNAALHFSGLAFHMYVTNTVGAAGTALLMLTASVGSFAATFAISGSRFTATRLVSEEVGRGKGSSALAAVYRCLFYAAVFGTAALALLYAGADFIGTVLLGDGRTVTALKILSLDMPLLSMGAVFFGYFTARESAAKLSVLLVTENAVRMAVTLALFRSAQTLSVENAIAAAAFGGVCGETTEFVIAVLMFAFDRKSLAPSAEKKPQGMWSRLFRIALPLAAAAYVRTALTSVCGMLVPRGLRRCGTGAEKALSDYGVIQGMAFPVIAFPAMLLASVAEILVPVLTEAQVRGDDVRIKRTVFRILRLCAVFSVAAAAVIVLLSDVIANRFYGNADAEEYIRLFVPLIPFMYIDAVCDGMLRGIGEQMYVMRVNILTSVLTIALVVVLLPEFGAQGYVITLYFTGIFNFSLSILRLLRRAFGRKRTNVHKNPLRY